MNNQSKTKLSKLIGFTAAASTVLGAATLAYLLNPEKFEERVQKIQVKASNTWSSVKGKFQKKK